MFSLTENTGRLTVRHVIPNIQLHPPKLVLLWNCRSTWSITPRVPTEKP